ncbi:sensor histidine kinase KdpD [Acidaminobacter sp. JC074]|uniref:sensor histidine kinase n=1 Tax=Acidaminobacter sp. JC074 TaxID=2530199 RepID=UPI001F0CE5EF|nr:HAMP domain-containing sensor histidine kinase [Acidaminobacter sp. JC074]
MINYYKSNIKKFPLEVLILVFITFFYLALPSLIRGNWFSVVVWIREAIHTGDGAKLFVASASLNFSYALIASTAYFIALLSVKFTFSHQTIMTQRLMILGLYMLIRLLSWALGVPFEPMLDLVTMVFIILLTKYARMTLKNMSAELVIALQLFIALQWLNTMPLMTSFHIGQTELPVSIKIAGAYLDNGFIQNMISISFTLPLLLSAVMTSMRFRANNTVMTVLEENIQKAKELKDAQTKIMENRVYKEVNAMAHDLKTPLVTIRGLNSMLMLSKDMTKLEPYTERIENAVEKMNELISGFLYGSHRQRISIGELINYVRAQVPIDNDAIDFSFETENDNILVCGNQIRLSRAIINIIENAIIATANQTDRLVSLKCRSDNETLQICLEDNGKGIEDKDIDHLFDIGYSGVGSTGLGLPFAKQIIEEHDGRIQIESNLNQGTRVTISLQICNDEKE